MPVTADNPASSSTSRMPQNDVMNIVKKMNQKPLNTTPFFLLKNVFLC